MVLSLSLSFPLTSLILLSLSLSLSLSHIGFWATFGVKDDLTDQQGIDVAKDCLRVARNAGVNLFDNAEAYGNPNGEAERIMGEAIKQLHEEDPVKWRRSDLIITTKVISFSPLSLSLLLPSLSLSLTHTFSLDILGFKWCK